MSGSFDEIESIGESQKKALARAGITNLNHFLDLCCTPEGRAEASRRSGLAGERLLAWTHLADLTRVPNVAAAYAQLLQAAGVDTVAALGRCDGADLSQRLAEAKKRAKTTTVRRLPSEARVAEWVAAAKALPVMVS